MSEDPFDDDYRIETTASENPFSDSNAVPREGVEEKLRLPAPEPDQPYHVFSKGRKRLLVGIIGVAGLFSGLSSNIYFPSLDAISKVSQENPFLA